MIPRDILKTFRQIEIRTNRIVANLSLVVTATLSLLFLCSCATKPHPSVAPANELPADTAINADAGRGGHLNVTLRLDDGREILFMVDTGSPITLLDKSLESELKKGRHTIPVSFVSGGREDADVYSAPNLYWGNTRLTTGRYVAALDFKKLPFLKNPSVLGILGMDCLRHYCIQLDFEAGQIHFLKPQLQEANDLGPALPLSFSRGFCPQIHRATFIGTGTNLFVDLGCNIDGIVDKKAINGLAMFFPERDWNGEMYTNLIVAGVGHADALGLRFLARHVVTFDFPKSTLYLKKRRIGPLTGDHSLTGSHFGDLESPMDLLLSLKAKNELPDCPRNDQSQICIETRSNSPTEIPHSVTFGVQKGRRLTINHYEITMDTNSNQWRLQRVWQTDGDGKTIEEFPIP